VWKSFRPVGQEVDSVLLDMEDDIVVVDVEDDHRPLLVRADIRCARNWRWQRDVEGDLAVVRRDVLDRPGDRVRGGRMPRGEVLPVVLALEADADRPGGQERLRGEFPIPVAFPVAVRAVVVAE
jgi:hypothetical protein